MAVYRVRGEGGNEVWVEVPSAAFDQRTFDDMVERGVWTLVPEPTAKKAPAPKPEPEPDDA